MNAKTARRPISATSKSIPAALILLATIAGCATDSSTDASTTAPLAPKAANRATDDIMMSKIEALEGEWEMQDENGDWMTASVFSVSSNGSVVREIMFPGSPSEMTNLYHMDGTDAVVTHYCAIGNQPRMVAKGLSKTPDGPAIEYAFDSVSNLRPDHDHVMGSLRVVFLGDDRIRQDWISMDKSGATANEMSFNLRRKQ
tara:strand:- start:519 stop:1118 length:600 start_codon:yes stop_codon:yes gene_type:complete